MNSRPLHAEEAAPRGLAMDRAYRIEAASVVTDVIDGEAVMLHRISGDYFSTDGVGC